MRDIHPYLETLASQASPDGGWPYAPGQAAHLEPTCLALLALAPHAKRYEKQLETGGAWLAQCAQPDGPFRLGRGRAEAVWPEGLRPFVQATPGPPPHEIERTAAAMLGSKGRVGENEGEQKEINDVDGVLVGWAWAVGNFSWVEPTAWACLALQRAGLGAEARVGEGQRLLLD